MKFKKTAFVVLGCAMSCFGCFANARVVGSGKMASETRAAAGAHGVDLACIGGLTITQGDKEELVVEAEDNLVPLIESKVDGNGVLVIRFKDHENVQPTKNVTFRLTVPRMELISLSGSGSINSERLEAGHEQIRLPGSGDITIANLKTGDLSVKLPGSGSVKVAAGEAPHQNVDISGSGQYGASGLNSDTAKVSISGSGEAEVRASGTLDVNISGSGAVSYAGDPKLTKHVSGSGAVTKL